MEKAAPARVGRAAKRRQAFYAAPPFWLNPCLPASGELQGGQKPALAGVSKQAPVGPGPLTRPSFRRRPPWPTRLSGILTAAINAAPPQIFLKEPGLRPLCTSPCAGRR